jgi:hypothetical protein
VIFGADGELVAEALAELGVHDGQAPASVMGEVRAQFARSVGVAGVERAAESVAFRLLDAGQLQEALAVLDRHGLDSAYAVALARVLRAEAKLPPQQLELWVARLSDAEAVLDPELARARADFHERRNERSRAIDVLRRAMAHDRLAHGGASVEGLLACLTGLESAHPAVGELAERRWPTWLVPGAACGLVGLVWLARLAQLSQFPAAAGLAALGGPAWSFTPHGCRGTAVGE